MKVIMKQVAVVITLILCQGPFPPGQKMSGSFQKYIEFMPEMVTYEKQFSLKKKEKKRKKGNTQF